MIGPLLRLIYLLTYLDTEFALLGSRQQFGINCVL